MDEIMSFRTDRKLAKELELVKEEEHLDRSTAIRHIFELGILEWKKAEVVKRILAGKLSISKGAKWLGISYHGMLAILNEKKIPFVEISKAELEDEAELAKKG